MLYQPGSTAKQQVKATHVILFSGLDGRRFVLATTWPGTEETNWLARRAELAARNVATEGDKRDWYNRAKFDLQKFLQQEAVPAEFDKTPFLADVSRKAWFPEGEWDMKNHAARGFVWGNRLSDAQVARDPFTDFELMISTVANTIASTRDLIVNQGFDAVVGRP